MYSKKLNSNYLAKLIFTSCTSNTLKKSPWWPTANTERRSVLCTRAYSVWFCCSYCGNAGYMCVLNLMASVWIFTHGSVTINTPRDSPGIHQVTALQSGESVASWASRCTHVELPMAQNTLRQKTTWARHSLSKCYMHYLQQETRVAAGLREFTLTLRWFSLGVCFHLFPSTRFTKVRIAFPSTYEVRNPHRAACYASVLLILHCFLTRQLIKHTAFLSASQINMTTREGVCLICTISQVHITYEMNKAVLNPPFCCWKVSAASLQKICISPLCVEEEDNSYPTFAVACKLGLGVNSTYTP